MMRAVLLVAVMFVAAPIVQAADGEKLAAQARECLRQADFDGAAKAFAAAAEADPSVEEYKMQARIVKRVVALRERLGEIEESEEWLSLATALRTFYVDHQIHGEALPLDRRIFELRRDAAAAAALARTELALGRDTEAMDLLARLSHEQSSSETRVLLALVHARQGELDAARNLGATPAAKDASPEELIDRARLHALLGEEAGALECVKLALQATPPGRVDSARASIRACGDFARLNGSEAFASALETESKIKASDCSSGTSCGKCPSRSKCSSEKPKTCGEQHDEKKDHAGCSEHKK